MRVSAVKGTADYQRHAFVTLDGCPRPLAVMADEEVGTVDVVDLEVLERMRTHPEIEPDCYFVGRYPIKQLRGHVEITEAP